MNEADQLLAGFHPVASRVLFHQLNAFETAAGGINRKDNESAHRVLCEQHTRTLRAALESEAQHFLQQHRDAPRIGAIDLHLRQLVQDYLYQFLQRCG
ncbi:MAG: hypothetical protein EOO08_01555 [Chitinophagaceae bacterium]|nr:MAG: hypothetical protein EOO08_01555 [Chitinophagaceae bacterium]